MGTTQKELSEYIKHLPQVFQKETVEGEPNFLGQYLKIFEAFLSGRDDARINNTRVISLEEWIAVFVEYLDPGLTPSDFITWLARWVALILQDDWSEESKRSLLKRIVPLYKKRGTKHGLSEYLAIFVGSHVTIDEFLQGITLGTTGTVGIDTFVGGLLPHLFIVTINFPKITSTGFVSDTINSTKAILDLEKPAHTYYALRLNFPGIIVGERSTVAVDTIIGSPFPVFV